MAGRVYKVAENMGPLSSHRPSPKQPHDSDIQVNRLFDVKMASQSGNIEAMVVLIGGGNAVAGANMS